MSYACQKLQKWLPRGGIQGTRGKFGLWKGFLSPEGFGKNKEPHRVYEGAGGDGVLSSSLPGPGTIFSSPTIDPPPPTEEQPQPPVNLLPIPLPLPLPPPQLTSSVPDTCI